MAKLTTAEFIEAIKELTVLELNDFSKRLVRKSSAYPQQQEQSLWQQATAQAHRRRERTSSM